MEPQIFLMRDQQQAGPFAPQLVGEMLSNGAVLESDLGWYAGMETWIPLRHMFVEAPQGAPPVQAVPAVITLNEDIKTTPVSVIRGRFRLSRSGTIALTTLVALGAPLCLLSTWAKLSQKESIDKQNAQYEEGEQQFKASLARINALEPSRTHASTGPADDIVERGLLRLNPSFKNFQRGEPDPYKYLSGTRSHTSVFPIKAAADTTALVVYFAQDPFGDWMMFLKDTGPGILVPKA